MTKQIKGISGKSYTVPIVRIPEKTALYSGNDYEHGLKPEPTGADDEIGNSGMWFSWTRATADGYQEERKPGQYTARSYTALRSLDLLDLWTPDSWNAIFAEAGKDDPELNNFSGVGEAVETKNRVNFIQQAKKSEFFPGSVCKDDACTKMEWRGLLWGPNLGEYKRNSRYEYDMKAVSTIYKLFPSGIDGFFALPTPSPSTLHYPWLTNPLRYRVFHEEINIRPPYADKLQYIPASKGGRTRRRKRHTRRRHTKKK